MQNIKRKILIPLILGLVATGVSGQRNYMGLSFGVSLPGEEFAIKSMPGSGGYALPGFVLEFSGGYIFDYYLGIAGTCTFNLSSPDRDWLANDLRNAFPGILPEDVEVNLRVENWLYSNVMAGPMLTLPVRDLNFDLRGLVGLGFLMSAPWELHVIKPDEELFEKHNGQTVSFAYMLGAGIRYNFNSRNAIRLSADYFRSRSSFRIEENEVTGGISGKASYDMQVSTVNLNLGLAWRF